MFSQHRSVSSPQPLEQLSPISTSPPRHGGLRGFGAAFLGHITNNTAIASVHSGSSSGPGGGSGSSNNNHQDQSSRKAEPSLASRSNTFTSASRFRSPRSPPTAASYSDGLGIARQPDPESNPISDSVPSPTQMTRTTRAAAANTDIPPSSSQMPPPTHLTAQPPVPSSAPSTPTPSSSASAQPWIRFSTYIDPRSQRPSLTFSPICRILPTGNEIIRVGRYSDREAQIAPGSSPSLTERLPSSAPVGFKSKVVSRRHCEFWFSGGRWYVRDVKSSSGTFLNHIRLSPPGTESRPFPINDGDLIQLGIDFKGGEEMIFRCVKMRLELNRAWQSKPNTFKLVPFTPPSLFHLHIFIFIWDLGFYG